MTQSVGTPTATGTRHSQPPETGAGSHSRQKPLQASWAQPWSTPRPRSTLRKVQQRSRKAGRCCTPLRGLAAPATWKRSTSTGGARLALRQSGQEPSLKTRTRFPRVGWDSSHPPSQPPYQFTLQSPRNVRDSFSSGHGAPENTQTKQSHTPKGSSSNYLVTRSAGPRNGSRKK